MLSISNARLDTGDRILAAAASCVVDFGADRVTLAEIARRARVSRPTVYRRWPDTRSIVASLLTQRITGVIGTPSMIWGRGSEMIVGWAVSGLSRIAFLTTTLPRSKGPAWAGTTAIALRGAPL